MPRFLSDCPDFSTSVPISQRLSRFLSDCPICMSRFLSDCPDFLATVPIFQRLSRFLSDCPICISQFFSVCPDFSASVSISQRQSRFLSDCPDFSASVPIFQRLSRFLSDCPICMFQFFSVCPDFSATVPISQRLFRFLSVCPDFSTSVPISQRLSHLHVPIFQRLSRFLSVCHDSQRLFQSLGSVPISQRLPGEYTLMTACRSIASSVGDNSDAPIVVPICICNYRWPIGYRWQMNGLASMDKKHWIPFEKTRRDGRWLTLEIPRGRSDPCLLSIFAGAQWCILKIIDNHKDLFCHVSMIDGG